MNDIFTRGKKPTSHFQTCDWCNKQIVKGEEIIVVPSWHAFRSNVSECRYHLKCFAKKLKKEIKYESVFSK